MRKLGILPYDPYAGEHFEHVRKDIKRRLRLICRELSVADFAALIEKMAREQVRGEGGPIPGVP